MSKRYNCVGQRFGRLTVIEKIGSKEFRPNRYAIFWKCECDCGNIVELSTTSLRTGNTKSCGCLQRDYTYNLGNIGGYELLSKTHNYKVMASVKARCENPNRDHYKYYGGRGVKFCFDSVAEATKYVNSLPNSDKGWTIDRINVNGNYEAGNLRWIPLNEQAHNKTTSVKITYDNKTKTISQWAKELGISPYTLYYRHNKGWSDKEILFGKCH